MAYSRRRRSSEWATAGGCLLLVIFAVLCLGGCYGCQKATEKTVTFKVNRLDDQATGKSGHQYLVFTDRGVFKDKDNIWFLKFNSSDLFGQLQTGHRYTCKVNGLRIPLFSSYENLLSCKPA